MKDPDTTLTEDKAQQFLDDDESIDTDAFESITDEAAPIAVDLT